MAVIQRDGACCPTAGTPVTDRPIQGSVGAGGKNFYEDVVTIQQMLNAVPPADGGPAEMLAEDGLIGPKTLAAISAYQNKAIGKSDGRIDVNGPTIKALTQYVIDSPRVPMGKLGAPEGASQNAGKANPNPAPANLESDSIKTAQNCLQELEPRLNTLRWKLTRTTTAMMSLLDKHFSSRGEMVTDADVGHVQGILAGIHHYVARANAFGKVPVENVILFDPAPPGKKIAYTVRGGDKMSTKQTQLYRVKDAKGKVSNKKFPGQSLWLTSLFAEQPSFEKHWTVLHEFAHFVGRRDNPRGGPTPMAINDNAYAFEGGFSKLSKFQRLHNAESLSLFFLECCIGTKAIADLPRLNSVKNLYDRSPRVMPSGDIVTG